MDYKLYGTLIGNMHLNVDSEEYPACICICDFSSGIQFEDIVNTLHENEKKYLDSLKFEKRKRSYLLGRYASKNALASLIGEKDMKRIEIYHGVFSQPIVYCRNKSNIQVGISHTDDIGAAVAFYESCPIGIDIERINIAQKNVLEEYSSENERYLIYELMDSYIIMLVMLWSIKEALSKIIRTGLTVPHYFFEIESAFIDRDGFITCKYRHFPQYCSKSIVL